MKPPNIVTVHFLSAKWSKKLFTINHYELQNGKCIVTQELSAYLEKYNDIALLADLMGHESIETTRIYLRRTASEQQELVDKIVTW